MMRPRLWRIRPLTLGNIIAAAQGGGTGESLIRYFLPRFLIPRSVRRKAGVALNEALLEAFGGSGSGAGGGRGGEEAFAPDPFEEMALTLIMRGLSRADALETPLSHYRAALGMADAFDKQRAGYGVLAKQGKLGAVGFPSLIRRKKAKAEQLSSETAVALGNSVIDSFPLAEAEPQGNA